MSPDNRLGKRPGKRPAKKAAGGKPSTARTTSSPATEPPWPTPVRDEDQEEGDVGDVVERLAGLMRHYDLSELEVEDPVLRVRLRRGGAVEVVAPAAAPAPRPAAAAPAAPVAPAVDPAAGLVYIKSPFVGTFYRAPSPQASVFVEIGSRVRKGQTLCIVEAMKLMNEIESEATGTVVQILVENGHAVEYDQPLFAIKP